MLSMSLGAVHTDRIVSYWRHYWPGARLLVGSALTTEPCSLCNYQCTAQNTSVAHPAITQYVPIRTPLGINWKIILPIDQETTHACWRMIRDTYRPGPFFFLAINSSKPHRNLWASPLMHTCAHTSLIPRPSHHPIPETGWWEGLGMRL